MRDNVIALRLNAVQRRAELDLAIELLQMIPKDRLREALAKHQEVVLNTKLWST